jgi:quercetin dioxygenase-like cupin family protein
MGENLEILKALTANLPPFPAGEKHTNFSKYPMTKGTCLSWHIFDNDIISIDKWFIATDTIFPEHVHEAKEIIVIYQGSMHFVLDGIETTLKQGDVVTTTASQVHSSTYTEDCWFITVTIPPAKEFLYARQQN